MTEFIKGLELSRLFYEEAVRPLLEESFPRLRYAAARLHTGSEVLGFDTEMSSDHEWGPRDFFGRPFLVIALRGFSHALFSQIVDERVRRIAARPPIGGVDIFSDSTDILQHTSWRATLRKLYE